MALPSVLMGKRELSPRVSGKIRPGIMILTKSGQANKDAAKLYNEGVAAGLSFEEINERISKGCGAGLLRPINTAYFTVSGDSQRAFGRLKRDPLPRNCLNCSFVESCFGGCPKHRFVPVASGMAENYLCPSYQRFFTHTAMQLAGVVRVSRSEADDRRI